MDYPGVNVSIPRHLGPIFLTFDFLQDYTIRIEPDRPPNLLFLTGQDHFRRRQRWNRAFSAEALKNYDEIISRQAGELLDVFDQAAKDGKRVNLAERFTHYT